MRKLVLALGVSTVGFAASTLYFWRELHVERSTPQLVASAPAMISARDTSDQPSPAPVHRAAMSQAATAPAAATTAASLPDPAGEPASKSKIDPAKRSIYAHSKTLIEKLDDPARRAQFYAETRNSMHASNRDIGQRLGLSSEEYERFIDALTHDQVDKQEADARCVLDPGCDIRAFRKKLWSQDSQRLAELLGPDRMRRYQIYQDTWMQRETVLKLRAHLMDRDYLSSELSDALVTALAEEHWRAQAEAQQNGRGLQGFGVDSGWVYYVDEGSVAQKMQSAENYLRRMRDQAAPILSTEQFKLYEQMQQEVLRALRAQLEKVEARKKAQR